MTSIPASQQLGSAWCMQQHAAGHVLHADAGSHLSYYTGSNALVLAGSDKIRLPPTRCSNAPIESSVWLLSPREIDFVVYRLIVQRLSFPQRLAFGPVMKTG